MLPQFTLREQEPAACAAAALVAGAFQDEPPSGPAAALDAATGGLLSRALERGDARGRLAHTALFHYPPGIAAERLLVVGLGKRAEFDGGAYRQALDAAHKALRGLPAATWANTLAGIEVKGRDSAFAIRQLALSAAQAAYTYTATRRRRAEEEPEGPREVLILAPESPANRRVLAEAVAIARGVRLTRDLGNLPPNVCTPSYLAERARELAAGDPRTRCELLDRPAMEALGMGALLAVARGSANEPRLIALSWQGAAPDVPPIALVGKGITFDTGGINLKPGTGLEEMKFDMCGAAAVMGTFLAARELELPLNLLAIAAAVENMPDGNAYRPSDVITAMDGTTIEVLNTDAEGRLILCDAMLYAKRHRPQLMVDVATLTGACAVALGKHASGLMSRDDELAAELLAAGEESLDRAWRLPLWKDYDKQLESGFADVANVGGKWAGAITAGCFLARFAEGVRWAHLDIAGTAWEEGRKGLATGRPVPLLTSWLIRRASA
ncbi:MAG: leucyl aminopeptidase [Xanthomonadales bacterium]|nr:leucyl aminopeptidase [Xanthomonadales bacterium]